MNKGSKIVVDVIESSAEIKGEHRYILRRIWDRDKDMITFILLNPSTADSEYNDPTVKKCIGLANNWGFGGFEIVNMFSFRCTEPQLLNNRINIIGEENERYIIESVNRTKKVVLAWGNFIKENKIKGYSTREKEIVNLLSECELYCGELTKKGSPKHPLYQSLSNTMFRISWNGEKFIEFDQSK